MLYFSDINISLLPLYTGPQVTICIMPANREYQVSKRLLCEQSPYFRLTFEGGFKETEEQATTLMEIPGVVSIQSFEMLLQWLYQERFVLKSLNPQDAITSIIEFVRIADMCQVTGMESLMAEHIKATIKGGTTPSYIFVSRERNTRYLMSQHIISASFLPDGHPVRDILAEACVEDYLVHDDHKFVREARDIPNFAVDLLKAVKTTLKTVAFINHEIVFTEPIRGTQRPMKR